MKVPLRAHAPRRVLDGFGRAVHASCRYAAPDSLDELAALVSQARAEGLSLAFRGAGRSYGDAALHGRGLVLDTSRLSRLLRWDKEAGVLEAEAGFTIEQLWRHTLSDGFWPAVVPGTMRPTLGGCVSMNIHGKNNFRAGPFGEHLRSFELLLPSGERRRCAPDENADLFRAAVGGMGLLGAVTKVELALKPVESGRLRVESLSGRNLSEIFDLFEARLPYCDYLVGWLDCFPGGDALGRGQLHAANYLRAEEDPEGRDWLDPARQGLPDHILGVPKRVLWRLMRLGMHKPGISVVNALKYHSAWREHRHHYLQSHVAFAFLLDYVPNWRLAYGPGGFIQYQIFVPHETARGCLRDVLALCQEAKLPSYLGVLKRHRADDFLLSHALDGWSLALDFRVTEQHRGPLWALAERLTERVLAAGGKFYFAKDAVLRPADVARAYGRTRLDDFLALKQQVDPTHALSNDLWDRVAPRPT